MPLNYISDKCMEVSVLFVLCFSTSDLAQRRIYGMTRNLNCTRIVLQFLYCFLQYNMEDRKMCYASVCYSTQRQKELKFFGFPRVPAWYVCFHS
jgi:hypothetical protein